MKRRRHSDYRKLVIRYCDGPSKFIEKLKAIKNKLINPKAIAAVLGLIVAVVGFGAAITLAKKSKTAKQLQASSKLVTAAANKVAAAATPVVKNVPDTATVVTQGVSRIQNVTKNVREISAKEIVETADKMKGFSKSLGSAVNTKTYGTPTERALQSTKALEQALSDPRFQWDI